jgi:hypothetical protein
VQESRRIILRNSYKSRGRLEDMCCYDEQGSNTYQHEYFQPVFDELDKLNKMLDSHIGEEKIIEGKREKEMTTAIKAADNSTRLPVLLLVTTSTHSNQTTYTTYTFIQTNEPKIILKSVI